MLSCFYLLVRQKMNQLNSDTLNTLEMFKAFGAFKVFRAFRASVDLEAFARFGDSQTMQVLWGV